MHVFYHLSTLFPLILQTLASDDPILDQDALLLSSTNPGNPTLTPDDLSLPDPPSNNNNIDSSQTPTLTAQSTGQYIDPNTIFSVLCDKFFHAACCIGNQLPLARASDGTPTDQSIPAAQAPSQHPDISDLCQWYDFGDPYCEDFDLGDDQKLFAIVCCGRIKARPENVAVGQERRLWPNANARQRAMSAWRNVPWEEKRTPGVGMDCHAARKDDIEAFRRQIEEQGGRTERGSVPVLGGDGGGRDRNPQINLVDFLKLLPLLIEGAVWAL